MATHLEAARRNDFLTILRHLFRSFNSESDRDFSSSEQFSSLPEMFNLWMIRRWSKSDLLPEDLQQVPELKDLDPSSVLDFIERFENDVKLAWMMGFVRWYWPLITVPRRPIKYVLERAYADFVVVFKGKEPEEQRTFRISCNNEYDPELGLMLEPQVIYQWHRCLRGASTLMLEHGVDALPGLMGQTHDGRYNEAGDVELYEDDADAESR